MFQIRRCTTVDLPFDAIAVGIATDARDAVNPSTGLEMISFCLIARDNLGDGIGAKAV